MTGIDYFFVIQQKAHATKAKIVKVDSGNEITDVQRIARELKNQHPHSEIHYVRYPTNEKTEVMQRFLDE